jgi:hypothetical protein
MIHLFREGRKLPPTSKAALRAIGARKQAATPQRDRGEGRM